MSSDAMNENTGSEHQEQGDRMLDPTAIVEQETEDLIARGITSPAHLGIMGGSNGGLLVGALA